MPNLTLALFLALPAVDVTEQPPELGRVRFERDLDAGLARAKRDDKPAFLLFQEIPGCATCRGFGGGPLSHPLLVDAIETCFVPIAIHNNKGGADKQALERFGEPAWNNPVVRFVDGEGKDVIPRRDGVWGEAGTVERMINALEVAHEAVPRWLEMARIELHPRDEQRVVFSMYCFWEGQQRLGAIDGVIDARPGFVGGSEVVDVRFDASRVKLTDLARQAAAMECAGTILLPRVGDADMLPANLRERARALSGDVRAAGADDDLRRLRGVRELELLPLTRTQAIRVNAELAAGGKVREGTLSPNQEALRRRIAAATPKQLEALHRPSASASLGSYEDELRARLDR
jgi:hypothetical protein